MQLTDICRCCGAERPIEDIDQFGVCSACDDEPGNVLFDPLDESEDDE